MNQVLIVNVGATACAIPLEHVGETLRPLPLEPLAGMPAFVRGLSVIRGGAVPVLDLALLIGVQDGSVTRFVTLKLGVQRAALAVTSVIGVAQLRPEMLASLPPILPADSSAIAAIGVTNERLLIVLRALRTVPDAVWSAVAAGSA